MPKLIQVIESSEKAGTGEDQDPHRVKTVYYTPEGDLLAEHDPWVLSEKEALGERLAHLDAAAVLWSTMRDLLQRRLKTPIGPDPQEAWPLIRGLIEEATGKVDAGENE